MKWTLFGVALLSLGVYGLVRFSGSEDDSKPSSPQALRSHHEMLSRAKVFRTRAFDASTIDFAKDPNKGVIDPELTTCRFLPTEPTGTTAKFDCELPNGEKIKVKYGWTREIPSEIAATRLLHAMGFGADRMSRVKKLRCFGCVVAPFHVRLAMQKLGLGDAFDRHLPFEHGIDFVDVAVERKLEGESVDKGDVKGWAFHELSVIDPKRGGATRAEVDALRLMAAFLNHWDNKSPNQRLVCVGEDTEDCAHPLAMIQDTGSSFGPHKMDLGAWKETPIWTGDTGCTISMKQLPYDGATFVDVQISDAGRQLLGNRLKQLSTDQIDALFRSAGFDEVPGWVAAFQTRAQQIWGRGPCPAVQ